MSGKQSRHTPKFSVTVDGTSIGTDSIRSIVVDQSLEMADMFLLDLRNDDLSLCDKGTIELGKNVVIELGYEDHGGETEKVMEGRVVAVKGVFPRRGSVSLRVQGYTGHQKLTQGRKTRSFPGPKTYTQVVEEIIGADYNGLLTPEVDDSETQHEYIFQRNQTDLEFFVDLADRVGFEVYVIHSALYFKKRQHDKSSSRKLKKGELLLSFNPRTHTSIQPTGVRVQSWDPGQVKIVQGEATDKDIGPDMGGEETGADVSGKIGPAVDQVHEIPLRSDAAAKAYAIARMQDRALDFVIADAVCAGMPDLRPGLVIELDGVGDVFNGDYYITRAMHDYQPSGFTTRLCLRSTSIQKKQEPPILKAIAMPTFSLSAVTEAVSAAAAAATSAIADAMSALSTPTLASPAAITDAAATASAAAAQAGAMASAALQNLNLNAAVASAMTAISPVLESVGSCVTDVVTGCGGSDLCKAAESVKTEAEKAVLGAAANLQAAVATQQAIASAQVELQNASKIAAISPTAATQAITSIEPKLQAVAAIAPTTVQPAIANAQTNVATASTQAKLGAATCGTSLASASANLDTAAAVANTNVVSAQKNLVSTVSMNPMAASGPAMGMPSMGGKPLGF